MTPGPCARSAADGGGLERGPLGPGVARLPHRWDRRIDGRRHSRRRLRRRGGQSFAAAEPAGRWWFVVAFLIGLVLVAVGLAQHAIARRKVKVGSLSPRSTPAGARPGRDSSINRPRPSAAAPAPSRCAPRWSCPRVSAGLRIPSTAWRSRPSLPPRWPSGSRRTPRSSTSSPTMPLHVGFRSGPVWATPTPAKSSCTPSARQTAAPAYFPAVALRAQDAEGSP